LIVPGVSNFREKLWPFSKVGDSKELSSATTSCLAASLLVQTTVVPAGIEISAGLNLKPLRSILTVAGAELAAVAWTAAAAVVLATGTWVGVLSPQAVITRLKHNIAISGRLSFPKANFRESALKESILFLLVLPFVTNSGLYLPDDLILF
jgi:hypothetical protein